jgi:hypothetical protein
MTKFSKSSLHRTGTTNNQQNVRRLLIGVGVVTAIFGLMNIFSSSSSDEMAKNPALKGGGGVLESSTLLDQPLKVETEKKEMDDRDFGKMASEIFDENPAHFALRDHEVYPSEYHFDTRKEIYHHYKKGQSGAVIEDILMCHAYAFHHNATYGGSCGETDDTMTIHKGLLDSIGLADRMPFACPKHEGGKDDGIRRSVTPLAKCREYNTRIWTPEYVNYLRSIVTVAPRKHDKYTIVVHIRRRGVTPCARTKEGFQRYLPNLHYMNLIETYKKPGSKVLIFSQVDSYEPLDEFTAKGYEVSFEEDLESIWHAFVTADVAIMSRSDFSMVPGLVAEGTVVYTPMWHPPIKGWEIADNPTMEKTDAENARLKESCPKK